jgi:hypothetical protein
MTSTVYYPSNALRKHGNDRPNRALIFFDVEATSTVNWNKCSSYGKGVYICDVKYSEIWQTREFTGIQSTVSPTNASLKGRCHELTSIYTL